MGKSFRKRVISIYGKLNKQAIIDPKSIPRVKRISSRNILARDLGLRL